MKLHLKRRINNHIYDNFGESWWQPEGAARLLHELNPVRFDYFLGNLGGRKKLDGLKLLDVGCGGGLLAEEFARAGAKVTGVDLSASSLAVARCHALEQGLSIEYLQATAEHLPFPAESFDVLVCCDFVEHVSDRLDVFLIEMARVLRPGGIFLYDTINRTLASRLIAIWILQDWLQLVPRQTHIWQMFVKPAELESALQKAGISPLNSVGLLPASDPFRVVYNVLFQGKIGGFRVSAKQKAFNYLGYGSRFSRESLEK
jgi:2-polyprenyl-6-hydroxyphenyl methylase/3-demethylubiquinone-9 3-methyltransferase